MMPRGYCPICERRVLRAPGEACPKHDVELLPGPIGDGPGPGAGRLVTVATFALVGEAHGPRIRLEAEGIPTFLDGERMGTNAIYQVATGGVKLQVPEEQVADARVLLAQSWSAPEQEDDDPWEGLEPEPAERRRSIMKAAILVFLFGPAIAFLISILLRQLGP